MDLGADRRGVDMGPSAIRYGGLADHLEAAGQATVDAGDIVVPRPESHDPDAAQPLDGPAKFLPEVRQVCADVADTVADAVDEGEIPLVLGGDHSIAIGTVNGLAREQSVGILWFDAHGDFNTPETTPSGNVHGMTLAAICGVGPFADQSWARAPGVDPSNVVLVGTRSLDPGERDLLGASDVTVYTMSDIDRRSTTDVVREGIEIATDGVDGLHVSLDLDALDPTEAPGVGTPVRGGISYREAHAAMELVASHANDTLAGFELVEVNPILDDHNRTAELAGELAASAFGQRIF